MAWAQLKSIKNNDSNESDLKIKIYENKFTFGRSKDCDLSFPNNKLLSSEHAFIEKDDDNRIWFTDKSRNGTLINLKTKVLNKKHEIFNNDLLHLVYRVNEPDKNICFQFELVNQNKSCSTGETRSYRNKEENDSTHINKLENDKDVLEPEKKKQKFDDAETIKENQKAADKDTLKTKEFQPNTSISASNNATNSNNKTDDDIADTLTCSICQEIMHDCVSLQPCMHTFCAGCYSEWMEKSNLCPICRLEVERISKNHIVNNLIEAFLKADPNKKRTDESLAELDAKNKISKDMLYPKTEKKKKAKIEDYDDEDEDEPSDNNDEYMDYSDQDEEEDNEPPPPQFHIMPQQQPFLNPNPFYNRFAPVGLGFGAAYNNPYRYNCRQCPANKVQHQAIAAGAAANTANNYPDYTCTLVQNHLLCQCCLEPMPDRSNEIANNTQFPKQICCVCFKAYCNLYWGCRKDGCRGCLAKFQDHVFDNTTPLDNCINENQFETTILIDWLKEKNKTIQNIFNECSRKMKNGVFQPKTINQQFPHEKVVCRTCALKAFKEYLYVARADIPKEELSDLVANRPNCKWGKNCRTQKHNILHAQRYNHVCNKHKMYKQL